MNDHENQASGLARRDLLKGVAAAGLAFTAGVGSESEAAAAAAPAGDNPIRQENAKSGTHD